MYEFRQNNVYTNRDKKGYVEQNTVIKQYITFLNGEYIDCESVKLIISNYFIFDVINFRQVSQYISQ